MLLTKMQTEQVFGQERQVQQSYKISFEGIERLLQYRVLNEKFGNLYKKQQSLKELVEKSQIEIVLPVSEVQLSSQTLNLGQIALQSLQQGKQMFFDEVSIKFIDYISFPIYSFHIQWMYNDIINPFTLEYKQDYKITLNILVFGKENQPFQVIKCYGVFPIVQRIVDSLDVEVSDIITLSVQYKLDQQRILKPSEQF